VIKYYIFYFKKYNCNSSLKFFLRKYWYSYCLLVMNAIFSFTFTSLNPASTLASQFQFWISLFPHTNLQVAFQSSISSSFSLFFLFSCPFFFLNLFISFPISYLDFHGEKKTYFLSMFGGIGNLVWVWISFSVHFTTWYYYQYLTLRYWKFQNLFTPFSWG